MRSLLDVCGLSIQQERNAQNEPLQRRVGKLVAWSFLGFEKSTTIRATMGTAEQCGARWPIVVNFVVDVPVAVLLSVLRTCRLSFANYSPALQRHWHNDVIKSRQLNVHLPCHSSLTSSTS